MIINHNIPALNAYRMLTWNNSQVSKNLEKLSSGLRINRAADDAVEVGADTVGATLVDRVARDASLEDLLAHRGGRLDRGCGGFGRSRFGA